MKLLNVKSVVALLSVFAFLLTGTAFAEMKMGSDHKMMKMDPNHKVHLTSELKSSLDSVLESTSVLSEKLFNKEKIESSVPALNKSLMMAKKEIGKISDGELMKHKKHLNMVMMQAMKAAKGLTNGDNTKVKDSFFKVNQKLTQVIKYFKVDEEYRLFFCAGMKKVWIAKTADAKNPYNSNPDCGKIIAGKKH